MKRCSSCGETFLTEAFYFSRSTVDGLKSDCKDCNATYNQKINDRNRAFINGVKDVPCTDCHIEYPPHVMQFDHLPQFEKNFSIGPKASRGSLRRLIDEIAKCEVVCSNCHAERTFQRRSNGDKKETSVVQPSLVQETLFEENL